MMLSNPENQNSLPLGGNGRGVSARDAESKKRYLRIFTFTNLKNPYDSSVLIEFDDYHRQIPDEFDFEKPGHIIMLQLVEMTQEEFDRQDEDGDFLECPKCKWLSGFEAFRKVGTYRCRHCLTVFDATPETIVEES